MWIVGWMVGLTWAAPDDEATSDLALGAEVGDLYLAADALDRGADPSTAIDRVLQRCDGPMGVLLVAAGAGAEGTAARRPLQCDPSVAHALASASASWRVSLLRDGAGAGQLAVVESVLEVAGSDDALVDALHEAVQGRHDEVTDRLLRAGAVARPDTVGAAARAGSAEAVARLTRGWRRDALGDALIFVAHHDVALVSSLLARGAPTDATLDQRGPPLLEAAAAGRLDNVRRLLRAGADPDGARSDGRTPLMVGARRPEIVDALIVAGADPDRAMLSGWTPLMSAARSSAESTRRLIEAGASVDAAMHSSQEQAVHQAARMGRADVLQELIAAGAELGHRTQSPTGPGVLPLTLAAAGGHADAVALLVASGAPGVEEARERADGTAVQRMLRP